jgi:4-methylaminobutanoate oxidase (formaldehyde-forming)
VGWALAKWIVDGKPPIDLSPTSCTRFKDKSWSEAQLQREAVWQYRHFYGAVGVPAP